MTTRMRVAKIGREELEKTEPFAYGDTKIRMGVGLGIMKARKIVDNYREEGDKECPRKPCTNYEDGCEEWAGCPCVHYKAESEE